MRKKINLFLNRYIFFIGFCVVLLSMLPYIILGEHAIVPYHDQLDGELLAYIYQAKYLFSGDNIIPEFLGGAAKTALVPPAPLAVFLFILGNNNGEYKKRRYICSNTKKCYSIP